MIKILNENQIKGKEIKSLPMEGIRLSNDIKAVTDVLKSDFLTSGPKSNEFELEFSKFVKSKYSVVFLVEQQLCILQALP